MTHDLLTEEMKRERDVRLYGVQAALDMAALRQKIEIHRKLSVSRESRLDRGKEALRGSLLLADSRPQVGPSTIHGADKPFNLKSMESYLWD